MPKDISERIIDWPYISAGSRGGSVSIGGGGGGGGGGGATNLDALTDVTLSGVSNGQTLSYNSGSGQWVNAAPAAMVAHALSGAYHTGKLNWDLIDYAGSRLDDIVTRPHSLLTGIGPDDHHFQQHVLATGTALGADHTISGAAAGEVLRAIDATHAAFDVLHHTDLDNVLPDQHHPFVHDIIGNVPGFGVAHTVTGADFTVVGVHPADTLALLPTSSAPGAAVSILKTDANGGIQLDTNLLYVDGANNWIGVNRTPSGAALDLIASANADHTQRIKMKSGQTARLWRIEDLSGNELIVLDSVGNLQSGRPGFVSGLTGWQITPQGNAEFNNIWARGELHATVFVKDEIHATGGTLLVATAGTLHDDAVISSATVDDDVLVVYSTPAGMGVPLQVVTTSGTFTGNELHVSWIGNFINVNDPPSGPGFYFQPGDIVRSKTEVPTGVTDFWLEVNSAVQNSGYATYSVFKRSGTDGTLPKGSALVSYGREGDGRILMTSDLNYAPYIDVFTVGPQCWTGDAGAIVPRMRMGRLDGIGLPGVSGVTQYGMIAGKDLSDANSGYLIASNLQFSLYKVDIRLNNGVSDTGLWTADGNLKIGSNIGATATTGFNVITTGARAGDVVIGNEATGNFMRWQQSSGVLTVQGQLIVADPGTTVTLEQMTTADNAVRLDAQGYATAAQGNATVYGDARRIVAVTGSWDSNGATQIIWGTKVSGGAALSAAFGNGASRLIADHAGASVTISTRTYLYVSVSGTGTMTMLTTTNPATVAASANNVLIAVVEPGRNGSPKASVSVVAGSTYISGGNIWTSSIVASQIVAGSITADRLEASTLTVTYLDPVQTAAASDATTKANTAQSNAAADATTKANTAQSNAAADATTKANNAATSAQTYSDARRIVGVTGSWDSPSQTTIRWGTKAVAGTPASVAMSAAFADATNRVIADHAGASVSVTSRTYLFVSVSGTGTMTMTATNALATVMASPNNVLIAVADPGNSSTNACSITVVAGSTYISGGNIFTGSIVATNIASGAVTANKIDVDGNIDIAGGGMLTIGVTGNIHSAGKTAYGSGSGFFLGHSSAAHKFDIGDANSYLRWDGANLLFRTEDAVTFTSALDGLPSIKFEVIGGVSGGPRSLHFYSQGAINSARPELYWPEDLTIAGDVRADSAIYVGGDLLLDKGFRMTPRIIAASNSVGVVGDVSYYYDGANLWLYICYATNAWRRILFPTTTW